MPEKTPVSLDFVTLDVFTDQAFSGNPLAVVLGADGLTDSQMLTLAREFNLSETIFVMAPKDPANTARVRIFFPTAEIPFAGHPTIGCAIHLACGANGPGDFGDEIRLEEEAGLVPVQVWRRNGVVQAELTAPVIPHAPTTGAPPQIALAALALGLNDADIGFGPHRLGLWQGGPRFLYLPVADLGVLARAQPMEPHWSEMMAVGAVDSAYLYTQDDRANYRARMFSPTAGIPEDPATGSASAILAAQLLSLGVLGDGVNRLALRQGVEMGRPSEIGLTIDVTSGQIAQVKVMGGAVPISSGRVKTPSRAP